MGQGSIKENVIAAMIMTMKLMMVIPNSYVNDCDMKLYGLTCSPLI